MNKSWRKALAKERRTHPKVETLEKKGENKEARPDEQPKGQKLSTTPVIQLFDSHMMEATMQDWVLLFDLQSTREHIYYYKHATRCVDQPCHAVAPWPVNWILVRFHPRHIWCGRSLPNVDKFIASLNVFANRIRWRWLFYRDTEAAVFFFCPIPRQNQIMHTSSSPFPRHVDLEVET